ncbi:MAG: MOSC domain-containing protein [Myxococcota bacterium]
MRVDGLSVYPLKSGAAIAVASASIGALGLDGDRRIMVVDREGHFVTQRAHPRLALVRCGVDGARVAFAAPGRDALVVERAAGPRVKVEVWGDWVDAVVMAPALDAWMSAYLDRDVQVVAFADDAVRPADPTYAAPDDRVAFADGFAILVTGTASLDALNQRLAEPVPMDRFRPNIVVATTEPWVEDRWRRIRVGPVELAIIKPCGRCVTVNVDQARGVAAREPLRTLAAFRTFGSRVVFGQNAVPRGVGVVHLGDPVEVLETGA